MVYRHISTLQLELCVCVCVCVCVISQQLCNICSAVCPQRSAEVYEAHVFLTCKSVVLSTAASNRMMKHTDTRRLIFSYQLLNLA